LPEHLINLSAKEIYFKIKQFLKTNSYKIIIDEPSSYLSIAQGSIWGILPNTAKKTIRFHFDSIKTGTRIYFSSSFAPEWKKLTIVGYVFSFFLTILSLWINIDLDNYIISGNPSFWSWIATSANTTDINSVQSFSNIAKTLAFFLILILLVESILVIYSRFRINDVAEEILNQFE
jgi:hypothetical protein